MKIAHNLMSEAREAVLPRHFRALRSRRTRHAVPATRLACVPPGPSGAWVRAKRGGNPGTPQHRVSIVKLDARLAPSYPAQCAGDALGERASAA